MVHVLQPGITRVPDVDPPQWRTLDSCIMGPAPQVYIRDNVTFSVETILPPPTLLGLPRSSIHAAKFIMVRNFPIGAVPIDAAKPRYGQDQFTLYTDQLTVATVPSALYLWVEDTGTKNNCLNPIGRGTHTYITRLSIDYAGTNQQLIDNNMVENTQMSVNNGGFRQITWGMRSADIQAIDSVSFNRHTVPAPGMVYVVVPVNDLNSSTPQTPGLFSPCSFTIAASFARKRPHIGAWAPIQTNATLRVAIVNPSLLMAGDWCNQVGVVSVPDVQQAHLDMATNPSGAMIHRLVETGPLPYTGHHIELAGGSIGSFFSGLFHRVKGLASHVWEKVKKDPLGAMQTVASTVGALAAGGSNKRRK
jgi:hypothetical protein